MAKDWLVHTTNLIANTEELRQALLSRDHIFSQEESNFFAPSFDRDCHDPWEMVDMERATDRLWQAIRNKERILVWGDYDMDGLSSTAILVMVLKSLGADVTPYLPHRLEEGYGLSLEVLKSLVNEFDVLVTVDCGISNHEEIAWLAQQTKAVIVVDHHKISDSNKLPSALAILHPNHPAGSYPSPWLSGVGVTFKLSQALLSSLGQSRGQAQARLLLDLVTLGTVGDMVPLQGENRTLVALGLEQLSQTERPGLKLLLESLGFWGKEISGDDLSWRVIPRLNAVGKIAHAQPVFDLLTCQNSQEAQALLKLIDQYHKIRRSETERVLKEAEQQLLPESSFVFAANVNWPPGVVGLVASRLAQRFDRPAIIVGGNGRHAVGSARSPASINVLNLLEASRTHVMKMGGHAQAAGFSLEEARLGDFRQALAQAAADLKQPRSLPMKADFVISPSLLTWQTVRLIEKFAPFGVGNTRPLFVLQNLTLINSRPVGRDKKHAKYMLASQGQMIEGIGFNLADLSFPAQTSVDVVADLQINEFLGRQRLQLQVQDIAASGKVTVTTSSDESHSAH